MQKKPQVNVVLYARDAVGGKKGSTQAQLDRLTSLVKDREREGWTVGEKLVDRLLGELERRCVRLVSLSGLADIRSTLRLLAEKKRRRNYR